MKRIRALGHDLKQAASFWVDDHITMHSAALAYYTVFSIAPLLVIAIAIAGLVLGESASHGQVFGEVQGLLGSGAAAAVETMVKNARTESNSGIVAAILSFITLILGATGVFGQLQESLNTIWGVQAPAGDGIWAWLRRRFLTFAMVGVIAFLLLVSLLASAVLAAAGRFFGTSELWQLASFGVSLAVIILLFAAVYKFLPDVHLRWRDLWSGAFLTALLFSLGKTLIGLYLGKSSVSSSYGAVGSLAVLLLWVFYSAHIFFFGAEFTKVKVKNRLVELQPKEEATRVGEADRRLAA